MSPGPNSRTIVIIHELGLGDKGKRESTGYKKFNLNLILTYNICTCTLYTVHCTCYAFPCNAKACGSL